MRANSGLWESTLRKPRRGTLLTATFYDHHVPDTLHMLPLETATSSRRRVHVAGHEGHGGRRAGIHVVGTRRSQSSRTRTTPAGECGSCCRSGRSREPESACHCLDYREKCRAVRLNGIGRGCRSPLVGANLRFPARLFVRERSTGRRRDRAAECARSDPSGFSRKKTRRCRKEVAR
jgi:hypothetical protein